MEEAAAKFLAKAEAEIDEEHQKYIDGKANFDESIHEQDDMDPKIFEKEHEGALPGMIGMDGYYRGLIVDPNAKNTPEELEQLKEVYKDLERTYLPYSYNSPYQTPVQHQGTCGSCSAFATGGAIEACFKKAGTTVSDKYLDIGQIFFKKQRN